MTIPKRIYQTCANVSSLRPEILKNIEKIKAMNPDWEYFIFDNEALQKYFENHLDAHALRAISKVNPKYRVVLADLFRYLVVYHHGGVYLDIKSTLNKPLNDVILPDDELVLSQWRNRLGEEFEGSGYYPELSRVPGGEFQQWHIIARENHPLLLTVINQVILNIQNYSPSWFGIAKEGVLRLSGPICYTQCIAGGIGKYNIRFVDIQSIGFVYSLYKALGDGDFHTKLPGHYSTLRELIVLP